MGDTDADDDMYYGLAEDSSVGTLQGYLYKKGELVTDFKRRWFVLQVCACVCVCVYGRERWRDTESSKVLQFERQRSFMFVQLLVSNRLNPRSVS